MALYKSVIEITNLENYRDFKRYIMSRLGDNLVSVELTDEDIVPAFYHAKEEYKKRGSTPDRKQFVALDVERGKSVYDLPVDNIESIVWIVQTQGGFRSEDPFHHAVINDFFFGNGNFSRDMLVYDLTIQQIENLKRYSAFHRQFIHHYYDNKIEFLKAPFANERWFLESYTNFSDNEFLDMTWIQDYTIAECKIILGRAYSKFSTLSTPAGDVQLNGNELMQEGKDEKEQLIEDIRNFVDSGRPNGWPIIMG